MESIIDGEQASRLIGAQLESLDDDGFVTGAVKIASTALGAQPCSGMINQDATHELCGDGVEVSAVSKGRFALLYKLQVDLVDQSGGLEGVIGAFLAHVLVGTAMEFCVNQRHEAFNDGFVAARQTHEQSGDLVG
uniref:Uncharacterized protein n=1 Tax=mine drainage metagenome TaxID=410659 RepID=E6PXF8_9ZZZZ